MSYQYVQRLGLITRVYTEGDVVRSEETIIETENDLEELVMTFDSTLPGEGVWSDYVWGYSNGGIIDRRAGVYLTWLTRMSRALREHIYTEVLKLGYEEGAVVTDLCLYLTDPANETYLPYKTKFLQLIQVRDAQKEPYLGKLTELRNLVTPPEQ